MAYTHESTYRLENPHYFGIAVVVLGSATSAQEQRTRAAQETAASSCEQRAEDPPESTSASYAELAASMLALAQTDEGPQNGETGGDRPVGAHVVVLGEPVSL